MKAEDHDLRTAYMAADDGDLHVLQSNGSLTRFDDDGDIDDVRPSSHVHAVHKYHPASLRVQILAMRILVCTTLFCVLIAVAMVVFSRSGVRLETFLSTAKDDVQRKDLLDSYNSYSGNIVSLLTKPFELFLTMVVAVTFLCFATEFSLRDYGMRATYAFIVVSALCGYFLTNGFNALNVQLSSRAVRPIVTADDLALPGSTNGTAIAINDTFSSSPRIASPPLLGLSVNNPLNNTVFKAIIGIERLPPTANCGSWAGLVSARRNRVTASYGFPLRSWQERVLPLGLTPTGSLRMSLSNATGAVTGVQASSLPMETNIAVNLMTNGILIIPSIVQWWDSNDEVPLSVTQVGTALADQFPAQVVDSPFDQTTGSYNVTVQDLFGLTSSNTSSASSSTAAEQQNTNALLQTRQLMANLFASASNASASEGQVEFTHLNITEGVVFDAMTIEIPLVPAYLGSGINRTSSGDWLYNISSAVYCGVDGCILEAPEYDYRGEQFTIESQVQALGICVNENGTEDLTLNYQHRNASYDNYSISTAVTYYCSSQSNTSMLVVSIGKAIRGDELILNDPATSDAVNRRFSLRNPRKVYTITIGRLSWEASDIAAKYGATCNEPSCRGLTYILNGTDDNGAAQHLIVGEKKLPLGLLNTYMYRSLPVGAATLWAPLVALATPQELSNQYATSLASQPLRRDLVLRRFFARLTGWPSRGPLTENNCTAEVEDYVTFMERNHLFIEHPLQAAYTAGFYFLFQNAVVRDLQPLQSTEGFFGYTLAFLGNIQEIDVRVSIPTLNIGFTIGGCVLLVLFSAGVILFGKRIEDSLRKDENAHLVAEVMVNDYKFPTLLLGKSIEHHQHGHSSSMAGKKVPLSDFRASAITLQDTTTGNRVSLFDSNQIHFNA